MRSLHLSQSAHVKSLDARRHSKLSVNGIQSALSLINHSLKLDFAFGKPGAAHRFILDVRP